MECEKKNENPDGVLAQAEPMLNFFKGITEERRADKLRIQQLEAHLKEIRQDRDNLRMIVDNLQNIFKDFNNYNSTNNLENSPGTNINVNAVPTQSVDGEAQKEISAVLQNDKAVRVEIAIQTDSDIVDAGIRNENNLEVSTVVENENEAVPSRVDIEVQTDHDNIAIDSNREKKQMSKTTRSEVCENEIVPDSNDISNYFSSFYVDSQTDTYNENTTASLASQGMVLSSFGGLDKGCVTLLFNENFATPNLALVQQNRDSSQSSGNVHFLYSADNCNQTTTANDGNEYDQEGRYYNDDHDYQIPVKCEYSKSTAKKRGRKPKNKNNTKKTKPSFVWVSDDESDSDYVVGSKSSTSEDSYEPVKKKKKKTFKVKCKVCEIDHKTQYFNTYRALDLHLLKKHSLNTFPTYLRCPYDDNCKRHYVQKSSLLKHIKSNHPDMNASLLMNCCEPRQRSWECAYCSVTFISHRLFKWHMDKFHPGSVETGKLSQTPEFVGNVSDVKTQPKTETPKKIGRTTIKREKGKFYVSKSRRLSVSSVDDDYDPDAISIPGKANKRRKSTEKVSSLESDRSNIVVVRAEIHETKTMTTRNEEPPPQPANPTAVTELEKNHNNSESTDLNDFVLNSINEISSIIEKQNAANSSLPAVTTNSSFLITTNEETHNQLAQIKNSNEQLQSYLSTSQHKPSSMSLSSLPCLLNDCPGCHYHPKPAIMSLTLDDEYVSSCRDEILADLYSIPDNPPMATDICDVTFASQSDILENTGEKIIPSEELPNTTTDVDVVNKTNSPEVENTSNAVSSSREDNYDTANDLRRQSTSDSNNVTEVDDKMISGSEKIACESDDLRKDVIDSVENAAEKIISIKEQPNKITTVDEETVVSEEPMYTDKSVHSETILTSVENENQETAVLNAKKSIANGHVDKTILPETSSHESENQFGKIDVNDRVTREDEIPSSQDPSEVAKPSSANDNVLEPIEIDSENQNEVDKTILPETSSHESENQFAKIDVNDRITHEDEIPSSQDPSDVAKPSSAIDDVLKPTEIDSENQNEIAKVNDKNHENYQTCDLSASSSDDEQCSMEVDHPELEESYSSQTDSIDLRSASQTDKDLLEANVTVLTQDVSSANAYQKSIFDPDDHCYLKKSNQSELTRNFDSSADKISNVNESDRPVLEKFQNSNRVDPSTICENTSANEVTHCESVHSAPIDDTVDENKPSETTSSTEVVNANADEISSPRNMSENVKSIISNEIPPPTADISSSLNVSTSIGNTTFYDEIDLVHACEVETCYEDSRLNTPASPLSQVSPSSVENRPVVDSILLKYLKGKDSHKSTNEMIEGVQIEIEIGGSGSSQSSAHELESVDTRLIPRVEVDEESGKNDGSNKNISENGNEQIIETSAIKSSSVCKKLTYLADPEFSSFVKRMLTEKSLGIAKERPPVSSLCMKSGSEFSNSSSSSSSSSCTCSGESCSIDDEKHNDHRETDKVPAVELESSHLSPMETDAIREKEVYEVDFIIESQSKSRPILSPLPMSPYSTAQSDQSNSPIETNSEKLKNHEDDLPMSPYSTTQPEQSNNPIEANSGNPENHEDDLPMSPYSTAQPDQSNSPIETNSKKSENHEDYVPMSPYSTTQPDQSNNPIEANSEKPENHEDDSSQLTTSSNQLDESDMVFDFGSPPYNISGKTDAELFSIFKLNMFRVVLTRLPIDFRTHSGTYELRRKSRISYASLNSVSVPYMRRKPCISFPFSPPSSNRPFKKHKRSWVKENNYVDSLRDLYENMDTILTEAVQNHETSYININKLCDIMTNYSGTRYRSYVELNKELYDLFHDDEESTEIDYFNGNNDDDDSTYYQDSKFVQLPVYSKTSNLSIEHLLIPLKVRFNKHVDNFLALSSFTIDDLNEKISYTNMIFGGLNFNVANMLFVHGSLDPWHALGFYTKKSDFLYQTVFINGSSHCADMQHASDEDIQELKEARKEISIRNIESLVTIVPKRE